jgi:glycosyltransferase involved in cell wall biosynthesis
MKITHIIIGLNGGGAELMLQRFIDNDLFSVHSIISLTTCGIVGKKLQMNNINVISLGLNKINFLLIFFRLIIVLRKQKPDIVQTWMYHADLFGGFAAKFTGMGKIFWNIRNTEIPQATFSLTRLIIIACSFFSYFVPNRIICCGNAAKAAHIALGYCRRKMVVIPNGYKVNSIQYDPALKISFLNVNNIKKNSIIIGIIGRYDYLKGYDIFVAAAAHLTKNSSKDIVFLCVGRGVDWGNSLLVSHIKKLNMDKNFILVGEVENVNFYYSVMDIFCLSSRAEGFPNTLAEAMLSSLPCVVTDVGDAADIVGNHGVVVAANNYKHLSCGLKYFVDMEPEIRKSIGSKARKRIIENYNIEKAVESYNHAYSGSI